MYAGEDLQVRGEISPKLAYSLFEYRQIFHSWHPSLFKMVDIQYQHLAAPTNQSKPQAVAAAFSGGIDSFYTLWAHIPHNQPIPSARITHGMFVRGLDLRLEDKQNFQVAAQAYQTLFNDLGLKLIHASTNAYQFAQFRINWTLFDGPPLIGAALLLAPLLRRFYTPSGMPSYLKLVPQATSPLIDHLLSTESLEIIHHGASISRYEKTQAVNNWSITHQHLRVCADKQRMYGLRNCAACHKCYRTMTILELIGATDNYSENFPKKLSTAAYIRWGLQHPLDPDQAGAIRDNALRAGRTKMAFWIQIAIILRVIKRFLVRTIKRILGRENVYRLKRRIYLPESSRTVDDL
jgi:hypothetical protein